MTVSITLSLSAQASGPRHHELCVALLAKVGAQRRMRAVANETQRVYENFRSFRHDFLKSIRNDRWADSSIFVTSNSSASARQEAALAIRALEKTYETRSKSDEDAPSVQAGIQLSGGQNILDFRDDVRAQVQPLVDSRASVKPNLRFGVAALSGAALLAVDYFIAGGPTALSGIGVALLGTAGVGKLIDSTWQDTAFAEMNGAINSVLNGGPVEWAFSSSSLTVSEDLLKVWDNPSQALLHDFLDEYERREILRLSLSREGVTAVLPGDKELRIDQLLFKKEGVPALNIFVRFNKSTPDIPSPKRASDPIRKLVPSALSNAL